MYQAFLLLQPTCSQLAGYPLSLHSLIKLTLVIDGNLFSFLYFLSISYCLSLSYCVCRMLKISSRNYSMILLNYDSWLILAPDVYL